MSSWERPGGLRLARHLREVVAGLREAAPLLVDAQVKAFEGMTATVHLASQPRRLSDSQPENRRERGE